MYVVIKVINYITKIFLLFIDEEKSLNYFPFFLCIFFS